MSRFFFESFFPATAAHLLQPLVPRIYTRLFPDDVAVQCPEVLLLFGAGADDDDGDADGGAASASAVMMMMRNPVLGLNAALGIMLGLVGGVSLLQAQQEQQEQQLARKPRNSDDDDDDDDSSSSRAAASNTAWALSLIFFGLMNACALPLHCLVPAHKNLAVEYPLLWLLDCYFTGASSMAILTACRRERQYDTLGAYRAEEGRYHIVRNGGHGESDGSGLFLSVLQEWSLWNLPGVACILAFVLFSYTLPLELWYVVPTVVLAAGAVLRKMLLEYIRDGYRGSFHGAIAVALVMGVEGILLDAPCCRNGLQGGLYMDVFMMGNAVFCACNVAFGALFWRAWTDIQKEMNDEQPASKKKQ